MTYGHCLSRCAKEQSESVYSSHQIHIIPTYNSCIHKLQYYNLKNSRPGNSTSRTNPVFKYYQGLECREK